MIFLPPIFLLHTSSEGMTCGGGQHIGSTTTEILLSDKAVFFLHFVFAHPPQFQCSCRRCSLHRPINKSGQFANKSEQNVAVYQLVFCPLLSCCQTVLVPSAVDNFTFFSPHTIEKDFVPRFYDKLEVSFLCLKRGR